MRMSPGEVRDLVGRQHVQLRILFTTVDEACRAALDGGPVDPTRLVLKLVRAVWDHIAFEDRLLLPTLREIDSWGPARADAVAADHAHQRDQLSALRQLAQKGSAVESALAALRLVDDLRADMDAEERDLLAPELLRDDVVAVDQSSS